VVLAIGIVVDDAIVVVENVERNLAAGMKPRDAAHQTMDEVGGALIAIALVLTAVFVPAAFIPGISGQLFRQFAVTIATSTIMSLVMSLTLSPALCAMLLKPHQAAPRHRPLLLRPFGAFFRGFNTGFEWLSTGYGALTRRLARVALLVLAVYVALLGLTGWQFQRAPTGFIPLQDRARHWSAPMRWYAARRRSSWRHLAFGMRCPLPVSTAPPSPTPRMPAPSLPRWSLLPGGRRTGSPPTPSSGR
jgi:HAE1 family hydrophobic/amphiphilic exporter-1